MGKRRIDIQRRILRFLLGAGLLSLLAMGTVSLRSIYGVQDIVMENAETMGNSVLAIWEEKAVDQTKRHLEEVAQGKARLVNHELDFLKKDAQYIANSMERILAHPERYSLRRLPSPAGQRVSSGEAYVLFTPAAKNPEEMDSALSEEIGLASNIADDLEIILHSYQKYQSSSFVASRDGYLICANLFSEENDYEIIRTVENHPAFASRNISRYQKAEQAGKGEFTVIYTENEHSSIVICYSPYYSGQQFAGVAGIALQLDSLYRIMADRSISDTDINFALNQNGTVMFSSLKEGPLAVSFEGAADLRNISEPTIAQAAKDMVAGKSGIARVTLEGREYELAYVPIPSVGWSFGTLIDREKAMSSVKTARDSISTGEGNFAARMHSSLVGNLWKLALLLLLVFGGLYFRSCRSAKRFVEPVLKLTEGVREIATGNLDKKILINTGDEVEDLANSVNDMTRDLKAYMENLSHITAEKERISADLDLAANIQTGMIPHRFPAYPDRTEVDLYASMEAAKEVGGDFYDFYLVDDNHLAVTMADVSGKGTGAALFMVIAKTMLKDFVLGTNCGSLGELVARVNDQLRQENTERMFVTAFIGILDLRTGMFEYVNAGHNPPLVYRAGESRFSFLAVARNFVLGGRKGINYQKQETVLAPGDVLFLYTDGVTEALNEKEELYGEDRLLETLNRIDVSDISAKEILEAVRSDVALHVGEAEQTDDITMMGIRFLG